ncbi:MAG: hypothetical protein AUK63_2060 [bacterium P3]|nr:MAG: hypothetical protein AUK63_2060 [bacterium P3]KWW33256.1 MAG: hypothetical protein F083_2552 [bacterium F083]
MNSVIIIITALVLFGVQAYFTNKRHQRTVCLLPVEAGPTKASKKNFMVPEQVRVGSMDMDAQLDYFVVQNHCMEKRGIYPGDVIGVQKLNEEFTLNDTDENSVMLIFLNDGDFHGHKIRVRGHEEDDGTFSTYYFMENGSKHFSTNRHKAADIRGVVVEVNHLNQA